jgi:poly(A) polymerase Pap1
MYWIEDENALTKLYVDNAFRFDLSSFPRDSPFYSPVNNRVLGTFKDETSGELIRFFIGLQAKMYAFMTNSGKEKMTAKGISYAVLKQIFTFRLYEKELFEQTINRQKNRRIASWLHRLFSIEVNKRGLCAFDSKRFLREGGIETFAFGHYRLRSHHESSAMYELPLISSIYILLI